MLSQVETYLTLFGGGVGILAGLSQLVTRDKRIANYNLAGLNLSLGLLMFQCAAVFTGYTRINPWVLCYHLSLIWLQAPLLYLAYFYLVNTEGISTRKIFLFIPPMLAVVLDTMSIAAYLLGLIPSLLWIFHDEQMTWLMVKKYLLIGGALHIIAYVLVFIKKMLSAWNSSERNPVLTITIAYAIATILATSCLLGGYITINMAFLKAAALITSAQIVMITPIGQRYPRFLQMLQTEVKKEKYKKSLLAGKDVTPVLNLLATLMEEEMLYRDENLTLKNLADRVSMTSHQLSQLLNDNLNTNFSNYINRFRITEAERILIEKPDRPVLAIAFDVGFNNKTSFYDAFSRFNGISPHRYRKEKLRG